MKRILILLLFPILVSAQADIKESSVDWLTDYDKAIKTAKKNNTNILMFFTGSDWCAPCKILKKDLFETEEFKTLTKDYTLLYVDIPMNKDLITEKQLKHNKEINAKYNKRGAVPLFKIINVQGKKLDEISGYSMRGDIQYHLDLLQKYK